MTPAATVFLALALASSATLNLLLVPIVLRQLSRIRNLEAYVRDRCREVAELNTRIAEMEADDS